MREFERLALGIVRAEPGQRILERAQHQRERRAEFVADVREERRLGAIDLGQRQRTLPLVLISARGRQHGADMARGEFEERAIGGVNPPPRVRPCDEKRSRCLVARNADRDGGDLGDRLLPIAAQWRGTGRGRADHRVALHNRFRQRPRRLVDRVVRNERRRARLDPELRHASQPSLFAQIDEREWYVGCILGQDGYRPAARVIDAQRCVRPLAHAAERAQAALGEHAIGGLDDGVKDAVDPPVLATHWAECEVVVAFLKMARRGSSSSCQTPSPVASTRSNSGAITSQISGHTSRPGRPIAHGCFSPGIALHASL